MSGSWQMEDGWAWLCVMSMPSSHVGGMYMMFGDKAVMGRQKLGGVFHCFHGQ